MALVQAAYIGPAVPFRLFYPGGSKTALHATGAGTVVWPDAATDTVSANAAVLVHDGSARFDNRGFVWVVVAVKGTGLVLYQEADLAAATFGSDHAYLFRVVNRVEVYQQT